MNVINRIGFRSSEEAYTSPVVGDYVLHTSSTILSLPRKRVKRTRGSSDDELVVDDDEIRNEEFRSGGPYLCNLPAITSPCSHCTYGCNQT